jgi:uncharacterized membrane protein HdeD (DUF308 family)
MHKVTAAARLLAVLLAIASAFITYTMIGPVLLILGGISAVGNTSESNAKNYLITIVLILGAQALGLIPYVGSYLAMIFASLGIAFIGASIVAITITLASRIRQDWLG